jgi:prepilin-type N-terminal cleavage/methylation domain-containing protein
MRSRDGFTLFEISIVLVIIGLIVGGVLVGRDLISAAGVRAQISQIEKYRLAASTFRTKYGYLPGDLPEPEASHFGFSRSAIVPYFLPNGNGLVEGWQCGLESGLAWADLGNAKMIDGSFSNTDFVGNGLGGFWGPIVDSYLPKTKVRNNIGHVYIWSGNFNSVGEMLSIGGSGEGAGSFGNYFAIAYLGGMCTTDRMGGDGVLLTVQQAHRIDQKIDDGLPQYGQVLAFSQAGWANAYGTYGGEWNTVNFGPAVQGDTGWFSPTDSFAACYDSTQGFPEKYSTTVNNGNNINCWLSFKFQ